MSFLDRVKDVTREFALSVLADPKASPDDRVAAREHLLNDAELDIDRLDAPEAFNLERLLGKARGTWREPVQRDDPGSRRARAHAALLTARSEFTIAWGQTFESLHPVERKPFVCRRCADFTDEDLGELAEAIAEGPTDEQAEETEPNP